MKMSGMLTVRVQIKDSGLTQGVDDEMSPFIAVKLSFRVHSKNNNKANALI